MNNVLDSLDPVPLGGKLQRARKKAGWTQEEAAICIGVGRTTITAIEKGSRRIKASELTKLAKAYGRQVNDFVRQRRIEGLFNKQIEFLTFPNEDDIRQLRPYIDEFEKLCIDYFELEDFSDVDTLRKYPCRQHMNALPSGHTWKSIADSIAASERNRLWNGDGPMFGLRETFENEANVRTFYMDLPSKLAGMWFFDEELGACMAVNGRKSEESRRLWMARNYFKFCVPCPQKGQVLAEDAEPLPFDGEKAADHFALSFLMPAPGLIRRFFAQRGHTQENRLSNLCSLSHYYGVSFEVMVCRLEGLELIPQGTVDIQRGENMRNQSIKNVLEKHLLLPVRYKHLVYDALNQEQIGEELFARYMRIEQLHARHIINEIGG